MTRTVGLDAKLHPRYRPPMNTPAPIDFWFDFSSPYSYIANAWVDALAARHGRGVRRHAILLGATFQAAELKSPVSYPLKREYSIADFARSARFEGLPYAVPPSFPIPTQNAARVFWWLRDTQGEDAAARWTHTAFGAYFTRGVLLNDAAALKALCAEAGLDAAAAETAWNEPAWKVAPSRMACRRTPRPCRAASASTQALAM